MSSKGASVLRERNAATKERAQAAIPQVTQMGCLEKKVKPTKISARYPMKGAPLLYATCAFGSLGDALFGYNSGTTPTKRLLVQALTNVDRYHVRLAGQSSLRGSLLQELWRCWWFDLLGGPFYHRNIRCLSTGVRGGGCIYRWSTRRYGRAEEMCSHWRLYLLVQCIHSNVCSWICDVRRRSYHPRTGSGIPFHDSAYHPDGDCRPASPWIDGRN